MESKIFKKLVVSALCAAAITSFGIVGAGLINAFRAPVTANAAEEVAERKDVKITTVDQPDGMLARVRFDLDGSRTGNGTFVAKKAAVGNYIYYNRTVCKNKNIDVHMRSNEFWIYPQSGTTLAVGDTLTFVKGLHFPVVTNDGEAVASYRDYLGDTVVYEYTEAGWVNKTEADKAKEQQVIVTALSEGASKGSINGETFKTNYDTKGDNNMNYTWVTDWVEIKGYLLLNGEPYNNGDIHCMSGNFYVYPSKAFAIGDTITVLEGLHMPAIPNGSYGSRPSYKEQVYSGYIAETYTIEYTNAGWVKQAEVGEPNNLKEITAVTENEAGATMPATYSFTMNFDLRVSKTELTGLEADDNYAANIYIDGKSVKEINNTVTAEDNDGETIPAVTVSAYGTGITLTVVKSTDIVKANTGFSVKVGKEFVCSTGNTIEEDITRYYISDLEYWTNVEPYALEKTHALTIKNVGAFEIIDNGANGVVYFNFNEELASKQLLAYNFHPAYMKTLPAAYPVDLADEFAASGATSNFITHVVINGQTIAEYWKGLSGAQAKSSRFECHILQTSTGVNRLRIGTNVSNGFDGKSAITITLKEGLVIYGGAYLDHDVTLTYTPADGDVAASTVYSSAAKTIELSADKTELDIGETAQLTKTVAPADYTGELVYVSSDETVATVSAEGVVTALKAGTAKITVKAGDVVSNEVTITVKGKEEPEKPGESSSETESGEKPDASEKPDTSEKPGTSEEPGDSASTIESTGSDKEQPAKSGCMGAVSASLIGIIGVGLGAALIAFKKKRD